LRDGLFGHLLVRQLQDRGDLAWDQAGEADDLTVGEFERIVMRMPVLKVATLTFVRRVSMQFFSNSTVWSKASSVPGRRQTATVRSFTPANPLVIAFGNRVETSFSPLLAARDATFSRL
jgi:hypothetical protein